MIKQFEDFQPEYASSVGNLDVVRYLSTVQMLDPSELEFGMEAFDLILNILPRVRVREENGVVTVGGFTAGRLDVDVHEEWGTRRVNNSIFIELSSRQIKFHSFFVLEVLYILNKLKEGNSRTRKSVLEELITKIYDSTWLKTAQEQPPLPIMWSNLRRLNTELLQGQKDFLNHYAKYVSQMNLNGILMAAPPGTGKTIAGFGWHLAMDNDVTVFVCPKPALEKVWVDTIRTFFKKEPTYWSSNDKALPTGREEFIIVHYESLGRIQGLIGKLRGKKVGVWLDESHNFNELSSQRTQLFISFCLGVAASGVVWASGTPLKAIGKEAVPLMRTIDRLFTEAVERAFVGLYGATKGRALDILAHRLSQVTFKIEKKAVVDNPREEYTVSFPIPNGDRYTLQAVGKDVAAFIEERQKMYQAQMPAITEFVMEILTRHELTLEPHQMAEYRNYTRMIREMHRRFDPYGHVDYIRLAKDYERRNIWPQLNGEELKRFKRDISRYKYLVLVIRGEALGLVVTRRRIECLVDMVDHTPIKKVVDEAEKKTLIFTSFVEVADKLVEKAKAEGLEPRVVYGATSKDLVAITREFKDNPNVNPLIATYSTLSTAVPIIEANAVMLHNAPFREYIRDQAISRIDRFGQDAKVHIVNILLETMPPENLTTRAKDILEWSKAQVDAILGTSDATAGSISMESLEAMDMWMDESGLYEEFEIGMESIVEVGDEFPIDSNRDVWYKSIPDAVWRYQH